MHLQAIRANHYMGHRAEVIEIPEGARAVMIAGPNGAGKTALLDALRFILTGDLPRGLSYKKDLPSLITEGEKDGWIGATLVRDGRAADYKISLKTGVASNPAPLAEHGALAVAPQEFMQLDANKRRRALFELHGVSLKQPDILAQLAKDGHAEERLAKIKTALGGGFDAAAKRAKELASEARGAWQATTGESYGAQKGATWAASVPAFDNPGDPRTIALQLEAKQAATNKAVRRRDEALQDERLHAGSDNLTKQAAGIKQAEAALATHDEKIAAQRAKVSGLREAASAPGGWTCPCPSCGVVLKSQKAGQLAVYDEGAASGPRASAMFEAEDAALRALVDARPALAKAVDTARAAGLMLERMPARPTVEELAAYTEEARVLLDELRLLETELETAKAAVTAEATAARKTDDAARYHADVDGFNALAGAIEGLPAKFLSDTLTAVNEALDDVSRAFGERVQLGADMELRYGTFPYRLLSESQQWRADLALGLALAPRAGALVLMDRFDMVQPGDRGAILQMLGQQQQAQVVIGATLKAAPQFPEGCGLHAIWLGS